MKIAVTEILSEFSIKYTKEGSKFRVLCPFHSDTKPSGEINESGFYKCWACNTSTNIFSYLSKKTGADRRDIYIRIAKNSYISENDNPIHPQDVQKAHVALYSDTNKLAVRFREELAARAVTDKLIKYYKIGLYGERISIPITNPVGDFVNLRLYLPGAEKSKFLNQRGKNRSRIRLTPIEQLQYDEILLCGGELKAYVAAEQLNPHGIGAIAPTCGEHDWDLSLNGNFENKILYVCSDIDDAGEESAEKRCRLLKSSVIKIHKIALPLDKTQFPKGDINDFIKHGGDLLPLIRNAEEWKLVVKNDVDENEEPDETSLNDAVNSILLKRRISIKAVVSSIDTSPYKIPKDVSITCPRNLDWCGYCPVFLNTKPEEPILTVGKEKIEVIEMVGKELYRQGTILKKAFGIPTKCNECEFAPISFYNVEDARISQQLDITSRLNERSMQIAYCIGSERLELNESYRMEGRIYPHPVNQQAALLVSKYEATTDALSNYSPTSIDHLKIFQPTEWTTAGLAAKLSDIYDDFEANVTKIYQRKNLHLMIDLGYHSPLFLNFDKTNVKGWTEILVVGDSSQGKSEAANGLLKHYGLGKRIDCKGATPAGLLGGVQQYGKRWFVSWGEIPANDRQLVILEELKGASIETISKLTDMRSSGIAEITKIERRRAHARTRILAISNPRSNRPLSSYNYGLDCILELIGNLEDVRRFDTVLLLNHKEVDILSLQKFNPIVPHLYTTDLCRELILYCWTAPIVKFEDEECVLDYAGKLALKFSDDIPIVDRGSQKYKLARLAAALAGRTFSIYEDDQVSRDSRTNIYVRNCHVEYVYDFLNRIYCNPNFGYEDYSNTIFKSERLVDENAVKQRILNKVPYAATFIEHIILQEEIDTQFIQHTLSWPMQEALDLMGFFIRTRCLKRVGRIYRKTSDFTKLLKTMMEEGVKSSRPSYVKGPDQF